MITIKNLKINIKKYGEGKTNILLLHGWGQSTNAFEQVAKHLEKKFTVYNIDLPGFGLSEKPKFAFNTNDYKELVREVVNYYNMEELIIIGHSFGGRVAIKYAKEYKVSKLVLVDSAGIVNKKTLKTKCKIYYFKLLKKVFSLPLLNSYKENVLNKFGSSDYKNADEIMKKILVNVVNEDLREDLKEIECPTLLVWGTNDIITPLNDAYIMKENIKDAGIVKIENAGHFSYLENLDLFLKVLDSFFKEDE